MIDVSDLNDPVLKHNRAAMARFGIGYTSDPDERADAWQGARRERPGLATGASLSPPENPNDDGSTLDANRRALARWHAQGTGYSFGASGAPRTMRVNETAYDPHTPHAHNSPASGGDPAKVPGVRGDADLAERISRAAYAEVMAKLGKRTSPSGTRQDSRFDVMDAKDECPIR